MADVAPVASATASDSCWVPKVGMMANAIQA